tara:strand:+ start:207 stop:926 length:720 start_codon:yes stop_codon:yes gene_type:complete
MDSVRYPGKAMVKIKNFPMIEHVYRRAKLIKEIEEVIVTTCDDIIYDYCLQKKINIIKSSKNHKNGTTRVAENLDQFDLTHSLILQGDEPLINTYDLSNFIKDIMKNPDTPSWNLITKLKNQSEMTDKTIVKCKVEKNRVVDLFRSKDISFEKYFKIMGVFCFKKEVLKKYVEFKPCALEKELLIEQFRLLKNSIDLFTFQVKKSHISVNIKDDKDKVDEVLENDLEQQKIFKKAFNLV